MGWLDLRYNGCRLHLLLSIEDRQKSLEIYTLSSLRLRSRWELGHLQQWCLRRRGRLLLLLLAEHAEGSLKIGHGCLGGLGLS